MKKTRIMILAAVAMLMAACSSDDESQKQSSQPESGWSELVTLTAGMPGNNGGGSGSNGPLRVKVDTSNPQKSQWETGDQLTVWTGDACSTANMSENGFSLISGADTYTGKFNGRLKSTTAPTSTTPLIAIIDNATDKINASAGNSVSVDLSEQVGATAESALDYELFYGTSTNATRNFNFTHKMALIGWTIKVNGASDGDKCNIVLSGTGLKNSATLDPATGTLTPGADDGTITLKDVTLTSAASTKLYVVLPPGTVSSGINATLTMSDGKTAEGSLGVGAITVEGNKYYIAGVNEFTLQAAHEYVDLGLPNGTLWATMNVGATSPEESGDFFAWGETTGYSSSSNSDGRSFDWASYKWMTSGQSDWNYINKYTFADGQGGDGAIWYSGGSFIGDNKTVLESADDAASANWGSAWRMPTNDEWKELVNNTDNEVATINGVNGRKFMKKTDHSVFIFLPLAGYREGTDLNGQGSDGNYWSSELSEYYSDVAWMLYFFSSGSVDAGLTRNRYLGYSVRPVLAQ